jgi:hypothetical protein
VAREAPRYLICGMSVAGLIASARFAIAPPRPLIRSLDRTQPAIADRAAEGYAALFARRYLTWSAAEPEASARTLEHFIAPGMQPGVGLVPPPSGEQRVEWVEVVQARERAHGEHLYTVAAQTDSDGLLYLTVDIARTREGRLALAGYPAFVGPPASGSSDNGGRLREVTDPALGTVVTRALRNYLAGSPGELAADLSVGAQVSLPTLALSLESTDSVAWSRDGRSVVAVVQARDGRGTHYTLGYELDVAQDQGRWEVSAVQMDPYA